MEERPHFYIILIHTYADMESLRDKIEVLQNFYGLERRDNESS